MLAYFILGALAAFGGLCAFWLCLGRALGCWQGCWLVCPRPEKRLLESIALYHSLLHSVGFVKGPLVIADSSLSEPERLELTQKHPHLEFCTLEEWERKYLG